MKKSGLLSFAFGLNLLLNVSAFAQTYNCTRKGEISSENYIVTLNQNNTATIEMIDNNNEEKTILKNNVTFDRRSTTVFNKIIATDLDQSFVLNFGIYDPSSGEGQIVYNNESISVTCILKKLTNEAKLR